MTLDDPDLQAVVLRRWRLRLLVVVVVLALGAAGSLLISVAYGESLVVPVLLWAGVGCAFLAWRTVPREIAAEERASMTRSATWVALAIFLYVVVPVVLSSSGVVSG